MGMYMFCFGILSRIDSNMVTMGTNMTTAKKSNKDSPYMAPQNPLMDPLDGLPKPADLLQLL